MKGQKCRPPWVAARCYRTTSHHPSAALACGNIEAFLLEVYYENFPTHWKAHDKRDIDKVSAKVTSIGYTPEQTPLSGRLFRVAFGFRLSGSAGT